MLFESEYKAVMWLCAKTKLRMSPITWLRQKESSSGTVLHCEMFPFFDTSFEALVSNITSLANAESAGLECTELQSLLPKLTKTPSKTIYGKLWFKMFIKSTAIKSD